MSKKFKSKNFKLSSTNNIEDSTMLKSLMLSHADFVNNINAANIFDNFWLLNDNLFLVSEDKVENINDQWDDFLRKINKRISNNKKPT